MITQPELKLINKKAKKMIKKHQRQDAEEIYNAFDKVYYLIMGVFFGCVIGGIIGVILV